MLPINSSLCEYGHFAAVQHGNKYEQTAIDAAVSHMRKSHINVNYSKTGFGQI
jgi:hypothetical protein